MQQKTTNGLTKEVVDNVVVGAQGHNDNVVPRLDCLVVSDPTVVVLDGAIVDNHSPTVEV